MSAAGTTPTDCRRARVHPRLPEVRRPRAFSRSLPNRRFSYLSALEASRSAGHVLWLPPGRCGRTFVGDGLAITGSPAVDGIQAGRDVGEHASPGSRFGRGSIGRAGLLILRRLLRRDCAAGGLTTAASRRAD